MINAVMEQLSFKSQYCEQTYKAVQFRRQVIAHACEGIEYLNMFLKKEIRELYGSGEEDHGPFSVKGYLKFMLRDGEWGDSIFLYLIASCWGLRLTVVRSDSCVEVQYRHEKPLSEVDIGLLYNCSLSCGHYWGLMRFDGYYCTSRKVAGASGYHPDQDKLKDPNTGDSGDGGDGGEVVMVTRKRLQELERKEKIFDEMLKVYQEGGGGKGVRTTKEKTNKTNIDIVEASTEEEPELLPEEEIQKPEAGDIRCLACNIDCRSPRELKHHIKKFHKGKVLFQCKTCGKGFMSKEGVMGHEKVHREILEKGHKKFHCKTCNKDFGWEKSFKKHIKNFHSKRGVQIKCEFCNQPFRTKDDLNQHLVRCDINPNRKEPFPCDICKKGKFYLAKELRAHKKLIHHWK